MKRTKEGFYKQGFVAFIWAIFSLMLYSCGGNSKVVTPSSDFEPYIKAYTDGIVSESSAIRICFAVDFPAVEVNSELEKNPFHFSPSIKGKAYWINSNTIEFAPNEGELEPGVAYKAYFKLGDFAKVDKELKEFPFSFQVQERQFSAQLEPVTITSSQPDEVSISGEIKFSCLMKPEDVGKMFSLSGGNKKEQIQLSASEPGYAFRFHIDKIERKDKDYDFAITIKGSPVKIKHEERFDVKIPAKGVFSYLSAKRVDTPQHGIMVVFSEPLSYTQDMKGLFDITQLSNYTLEIENNKAWIFFDEKGESNLTLNLHEGIRNYEHQSLGSSHTISFAGTSLKPMVEMPNDRAILPDSKNLVIPFRAVNLYAVDLSIIRIYESNLLSFMQSNTLGGDSELRRLGRLVYRNTLWFDDETRDIHQWQDYSIDLANLINQEPGAIYRVILSFRQEYSAYACAGSTQEVLRPAKSKLVPLSAGVSEEVNSEWDEPYPYYNYNGLETDWSLYEWKERENPCHISYYMNSSHVATCNVFASNIGMIVKENSLNKLWVAVTNLLDTQPIEGAVVTAYNYQLQKIASEKTDKNGFAVMEAKAKSKPFLLLAEYNNQKSFVRALEGEEQSVSRFDVGGKEIQKGLKGFVYGERGVWRPGDTLHVSFILEDKEKRIPSSHPVTLELYNPNGQFYTKLIATNSLNGFYTFDVPTKQEDPTGFWNAYVKVGGSTFHKALRIETIKPNRLKIDLRLPELLSVKNKEVVAPLAVSWLTGAKASNLQVKVDISLSKVNTQFKNFSQYLFNNPATDFTFVKSELYSGTIDADGKGRVPIKLAETADAPGMLNAQINTRVFEPGGDASFYTQTVPYSPFSYYVGINLNQPNKKAIETDKEHRFDVVTVDEKGNLVDRSDLEYKIYRIDWSWWWEENNQSFSTYVNGTSVVPIASGKLQTLGGKGSFTFRVNYPDWGRYLVYVKDRQSGHATGGTVFVDWPEWRGRSQKADPSGLKMLTFSLDKESYEIGEKATAIIPASSGGRALVSIENGTSVLKQEWVEIAAKKDTKYSFTVSPEMAPNVYLHISLLQPHAQTINDMPIRMYGVVPVYVSNKQTQLRPVIQMEDVLRPETDVNITVREESGKPMTYTLALVDEGLLDLTNFQTPDPWNEFYSKEALGIRTWDMYDDVLGAFSGRFASLFSIGGDATLKPADSKANRFKPVVKFIGPFHLNKGSKKTHTLQLPMYVGAVRAMLVAGEEGAYGCAEKSANVRNPLMLLSTLPRVLSVDEEIEVPVNIFAMEKELRNVTVSMKVEGAGVNIVGSDQRSLSFSAPGDQLTSFRLKTGETTGKVVVRLFAKGSGHEAKETIELEVRNPNPIVTIRQEKWILKGEKASLEYGMVGNLLNSKLQVEVSNIPVLDFSRRCDYLYNYQHYCTEQLASKSLPLLYIQQMKELDKKEMRAVKENIEAGIQQLYSRQLPNGGFVYWPGNAVADEWITSYVGLFLVKAKEKGYTVHANVFDKWKRFQQLAAQYWTIKEGTDANMAIQLQQQQAFRLYTLALAESPEYGAMNRMYEQAGLSKQAAYLLAAAYASIGKKKNAEELLFKVRLKEEDPCMDAIYGTANRDKAMLLDTYLLMGRNDDALKLAKELSESLSNENIFDTQSSAFALMALGQLAEKMSGTLKFSWAIDEERPSNVSTTRAVYTKAVDIDSQAGTVEVVNNGEGALNAAVVTSAQLLRDTLPPMSNQISLQVKYVDMSDNVIDVSRIAQGTDFKAIVTITNLDPYKDYTRLALTHILPSGWEIYSELKNEPFTYQDIRDDRVLTYFDLGSRKTKQFTVRLQATYLGEFILPAIQCEAMYDTSVMARSKAGRTAVMP